MKFKWIFPQSTYHLICRKNFIKACGSQAKSYSVSSSKSSILTTCNQLNSIATIYRQSSRFYCENLKDPIQEFNENVIFEELNVDKFKELIKSDQDAENIETVLASYEIAKYETGMVPTTLTLENMSKLMQLSYYKRGEYLLYLFNRELSKYRKKAKLKSLPERHPHLEIERAMGLQQFMGVRFNDETGAPLYGEWLNSHFLRIRKAELSHSLESNLVAGYMFGPKIVIDCDYDLNPVEAKKIAWDLHYSMKKLGHQIEPFNLILTGPFNESYKKTLNQVLIACNQDLGYLGVQRTDEHFLDLFPKNQIAYLSPYSIHSLKSYDKDTIYVLGGLPDVQSVNNRLGSLKKIKALGLKSYRFPLDDHFVFKTTKRLSLYECINILDHLSLNGDMAKALKYGVSPGRYKSEDELRKVNEERTTRILRKSFRSLHGRTDNTESS